MPILRILHFSEKKDGLFLLFVMCSGNPITLSDKSRGNKKINLHHPPSRASFIGWTLCQGPGFAHIAVSPCLWWHTIVCTTPVSNFSLSFSLSLSLFPSSFFFFQQKKKPFSFCFAPSFSRPRIRDLLRFLQPKRLSHDTTLADAVR